MGFRPVLNAILGLLNILRTSHDLIIPTVILIPKKDNGGRGSVGVHASLSAWEAWEAWEAWSGVPKSRPSA